ncbi:hypothetical protein Tco_0625618 [Tanacetum coccineum]|uniref:Uncharacterized protein n=1 Tax=Tanacetum coccineum TaxID=301880 RepID=A0ABQ4WHC8_9ASTR
MAEIGCNWARIGPSKSSQSLSNAHKWAVVTTVHLPAMINKIQVVAKKSDTAKKNRYTFLVITSFETTSELFRLISNIRQSTTAVQLPVTINNNQVAVKKLETGKGCENVTTLLRNGSAAENAALLMQEKGASQQEKPRHR